MRLRVARADASALELVGRVMGTGGSASVAAEQPLAFDRRFAGVQVCVEDERPDSPVLSTCTFLVRDLVTPEARLRLGLIGSVATDPARRGRGLATRALELAERELSERGCLASLLWADDERFYASRGYRAAGTEIDWALPCAIARALPPPSRVRPYRPADAPAVHALYERHERRVLRSPAETAALLAAPRMRVLVRDAPGDGADVLAYACLGRGRDLTDVIHERGGDPEDVLALVRALLEAHASEGATPGLFLIAPSGEDELASRLAAAGATPLTGVLGMAKILRPDLACEAIQAAARGPAPSVRIDGRGGPRLEGPRGTFELDEASLHELLIGARGERVAVERAEEHTGLQLPGNPLAPFLWGLDSI